MSEPQGEVPIMAALPQQPVQADADLEQRLRAEYSEISAISAQAARLKAAGFVFTKAPTIIRAFDQGAMIKSKHGFWLAIPTPAAGTGARGKRMTPGLWEQMHGARLRFIYRRGAPSLLVAENMRARTGKRGGFGHGSASALRSGRGLATVVMFILVPQVNLKKRLDVGAAAERWADALPGMIVGNWRE